MAVADQPIAALRVDGPTVVARAAGRAVRLTLPALVVGATTAAPPEIRGHEVVLDGVVVARFAGAARAVARGPAGAPDAHRAALARYGMAIGIAFQHADDRDDGEHAALAVEHAAQMRELCARAEAIAAGFGPPGGTLAAVAAWIGARA